MSATGELTITAPDGQPVSGDIPAATDAGAAAVDDEMLDAADPQNQDME